MKWNMRVVGHVPQRMVQNLHYLEDQLLNEDIKVIKEDYLTYDIVMSLTVCRKNKIKINEDFLQILVSGIKRWNY